jgi:putative transposase
MAVSGPQWEVMMKRKRYSVEQIIGKLREAEVHLSQGQTVKEVSRVLGVTEQTYYRWRKEYGGLKVSPARRLKEMERENSRLKKAVAELTLDKVILKEALEGKY